jgi:hypothetical protein
MNEESQNNENQNEKTPTMRYLETVLNRSRIMWER